MTGGDGDDGDGQPLDLPSCLVEDFADVVDDDMVARQAAHMLIDGEQELAARDTPPIFDGVPRVRGGREALPLVTEMIRNPHQARRVEG